MDLDKYPFIGDNILFRRYDEIEVIDIKKDVEFSIDDEAYELLMQFTGKNSLRQILEKYSENKRDEIIEVINFLTKENVIHFSDKEIRYKRGRISNRLKLPKKNPFNPPYLKYLMINITEKCNLNCKHCYITNKKHMDIPLEKLRSIIKKFYKYQGLKLILTGGEPFLYYDFIGLLEWLKNIPLQKVLLTNGTLIKNNEKILNLLKENFFEVFVSVDGLEASHNDLRNANCFNDVIEGIKILLDNNIKVSINTMVHKKNIKEFDELSKFLKSLGPIKSWAVDIPTFDENTPKDIQKEYGVSYDIGGTIIRDYWWGESYDSSGVIVGNNQSDSDNDEYSSTERDLSKHQQYACGPFLMAIDVIGKITKCGFFSEQSPGNIFKLGIRKAWQKIQNTLIWTLDELECYKLNCEFIEECRGGCRYRAFQHKKDIFAVDPYKCYAYGKLKERLN
ncbi:MAG: radical SAM protein [Promethearchaeia archaeon]